MHCCHERRPKNLYFRIYWYQHGKPESCPKRQCPSTHISTTPLKHCHISRQETGVVLLVLHLLVRSQYSQYNPLAHRGLVVVDILLRWCSSVHRICFPLWIDHRRTHCLDDLEVRDLLRCVLGRTRRREEPLKMPPCQGRSYLHCEVPSRHQGDILLCGSRCNRRPR